MRHYTNAMRNYAIFRGRASRAEFWSFYAVFIVMLIVVVVVDQSYFGTNRESSGVISLLFAAVHILPGMAVQVRRLHDIDWSGWAILINIVPFGTIVMLVLACLRGTQGPNRFGVEPGVDGDEDAFTAVPTIDQRRDQRRGDSAAMREPAFGGPHEPTRFDLEPAGYLRTVSPANGAASALAGQINPPATHHTIAAIERLAKLRDNGSITDEEFRAMKARTLAASE